MFNVMPTQEQIDYVNELLKVANFGMRGEFDGNYDQQYTGILAQTIIADLLNKRRPEDSGGSDGGVDFNLYDLKIDLKTMGRTVPVQNHFVHNFYGAQIKFDTDILLFASFNKRASVLTICGWLTKNEFKQYATHYPQGTERMRDNGSTFRVKGKHGNYEVEQQKLNQLNSVMEFHNSLEVLGGLQ